VLDGEHVEGEPGLDVAELPIACANWPGQKMPVGAVTVTLSVVSGERLMASTPRGMPKPGIDWSPAAPTGQSRVRPTEFVLVQGRPALGPTSQLPVAGLGGEPLTGKPPL
jgi:hypothetical protein